jgi:predicted glycoside hydrolase/deacetylase ChbG (UPF0249 family)
MLRLIVNADDFGYTPGINRAILDLHGAAVLTSATLMATGSALEDAVAQIGRCGSASKLVAGLNDAVAGLRPLGVGCHIVLVDGETVSPAEEISSLIQKVPARPPRAPSHSQSPSAAGPAPDQAQARFHPTLAGFTSALLLGRLRESEIEREAVAQIRLLQARGLVLTHLDTHKHTHMFPQVLRPLLRAAQRCGIHAIRNPFEPGWSVAATPSAPLVRRAEVRLLAQLRPAFLKIVKTAGLRTTDGAIGVLATGTLDATALASLLHTASCRTQTEEPVLELVCHPGYLDAELAAQPTRLQAARELERQALMGALPFLASFRLIHFGEL